MTVSIGALEATWPDHLLTLAEWDELPEEVCRRSELVEGVLVVVPSPGALHQRVMASLCAVLNQQLPAELCAVPDVDVVLETTPLPTVRRPDLVVIATDLVEANAGRLTGPDVVLAVEIVSPGSGRIDRVAKLAEYEDAGIESYWILELGPPVVLAAYHLVNGSYQNPTPHQGLVTLAVPAPLQIDLDSLVRR